MKYLWHNGLRMKAFAGFAIGLMLATTCAVQARAQEPMHGRVSFEDGSALIRGGSDEDWSYATVNTIILPGDSLWADQGGTIEMEMSGGTFVRLADGSRAEITALTPGGLIRGQTGSFYIQRTKRSSGSISFETPAGRIEVDPDTHVRIDIVGEGATTVSVRWGRVSVKAPGGGATIVTDGKRVYIDPGFLPSAPQLYDVNYEDSFDAWARERAKFLAVGPQTTPKYVTPAGDTPIGYYDLEPYGDWVTVDNTPYWRPTVVSDYVPYRSGYWSYVPSCGYTWVGGYPFSYITTHYGRWNYNDNYGWLWCYRDSWAPAWAYTARCGDYYVWSPLDIYDRPCYSGDAYFNIGGIRIGIGSSSYCYYNDVCYGPSYVYGCNSAFAGNIRANNVYLWNICAPNSRFNNYPRNRNFGTALVRDYTPQRYIRGLDTLRSSSGGEHLSARSRAVQLEGTVSHSALNTAGNTHTRGLRTQMREESRSARVRNVNVSEQTQHETRLLASRDIGSWAAQTVHNRDVRGGKPDNSPATGRIDQATTPSGHSDRIPATTGGEPNRYRADRDKPRGGIDNGSPTVRTPRSTADRDSSDGSTIYRGWTGPTPRTTAPPADVTSRVPTRNVRGATGSNDSARDFKLPRTRGNDPIDEGGPGVADRGTRSIQPHKEQTAVPGRDYAGVPPARDRSDPRQFSDSDNIRTPSRQDVQMPETPRVTDPRTHRYDAPRVEEPRVETPRYEAPRYDSPQRMQVPDQRAPEIRRPEMPSMPDRPQRMDVPQREAPRYEAPQRNEIPQREAPRYEAPQQREAPRYEAPRSEAPRYEAPQRSIDNSDRGGRGGGGNDGGGRGRSK